MYAFEKFLPHFAQLSVNYELVYVDGKPAVELGFRVFCLNEFKVRGFIDLVLRDKRDGKLLVFELKTTRFTNVHPAMYKIQDKLWLQSDSGLCKSEARDALESNFKVLYYVYKTSVCEYEAFHFLKTIFSELCGLKVLCKRQNKSVSISKMESFPCTDELL